MRAWTSSECDMVCCWLIWSCNTKTWRVACVFLMNSVVHTYNIGAADTFLIKDVTKCASKENQSRLWLGGIWPYLLRIYIRKVYGIYTARILISKLVSDIFLLYGGLL